MPGIWKLGGGPTPGGGRMEGGSLPGKAGGTYGGAPAIGC